MVLLVYRLANSTVNEMGDLHGLIARTLKDQILNGTNVVGKDGSVYNISVTPATLNVARQFLRDNNIECLGATNEDIQSLTEALPFDELPARSN